MMEALLQDATEALLAQQAEIARLHRVLAWCRARLEAAEARQMDGLVRKPDPAPGAQGRRDCREFRMVPVAGG